MKSNMVKDIITDNNEQEFQLRHFKKSGSGLLTTRSGKHYFIFDSADSWYDLIQAGYPRKFQCACRNDYFTVQFDFVDQISRSPYEVEVYATCCRCQQKLKVFTCKIDPINMIKYLDFPLSHCARPKIKYRGTELTAYWSREDLSLYLRFMCNELNLFTYSWYRNISDGKEYFMQVSFSKAVEIMEKHRYFFFYFASKELKLDDFIIEAPEVQGNFILKPELWRQKEVIRLSEPVFMAKSGYVYFIEYTQKKMDNGFLLRKSNKFERIVGQMNQWLTLTFSNARGKNCFDGEDAIKIYNLNQERDQIKMIERYRIP